MFPAQVWVCYPRLVYQHSPCLNERYGSGVRKHPEGEMKVCRKDHWKPQSPVRKGGVVYTALGAERNSKHRSNGASNGEEI